MSNVWFTGDLHWGHKNVTKWRDFDSEEEHRKTIKMNLLSVAKKRDMLWILGDSLFDENPEIMKDLIEVIEAFGSVRLLIGNHCGQHMSSAYRKDFLNLFDGVYGIHKKYGCWLQHGPGHPDELRGKWCVHGHVHESSVTVEVPDPRIISGIGDPETPMITIEDPRYFNMCLEKHNYFPRDLHWLHTQMEDRRPLLEKYGLSLGGKDED